MRKCLHDSMVRVFLLLGLLTLIPGLSGCGEREVALYVSVDQPYSEPVLASFTSLTGIVVRPLFDAEAAKTVGIVGRLRAEAGAPQCDVFWNSEFAHTMALAREGLLERYFPPTASDIPAFYRDPDGSWTAIGLRARVLLVNTSMVAGDTEPKGLADLLATRWQAGQVAVSSPLFGSALTHAAALYATSGEEATRGFFAGLQANGVLFLDGNSMVRDRVVAGAVAVGMVDSDDALVALAHQSQVRMILPDQGPGGSGTLLLPNTVAIIKNAPHPVEARRLVDYLVSAKTELMLAHGLAKQIPVRPALRKECGWLPPGELKGYSIALPRIAHSLASVTVVLKGLFLK